VDSAPGAGSRFDIRLPLASTGSENSASDDVSKDACAKQPLRVLLVDDDDELRELLAHALRQGGCHVDVAASAAEALRMIDDPPPHVLICDNRMPDMDGTMLLAALRPRWPQMPTILISAFLDGYDEPFEPWVVRMPKPFSPDDLLVRIRELVKQCQARRERQEVTNT